MGDFNINLLKLDSSDVSKDFFETMISYSLCPTIFKPTRITCHTASLIDNCFTNSFEDTSSSGILVTDISDHLPIFLISEINLKHSVNSRDNHTNILKREINQDRIDSFKMDLLTTDWQSVMIYFWTNSNLYMIKIFQLERSIIKNYPENLGFQKGY